MENRDDGRWAVSEVSAKCEGEKWDHCGAGCRGMMGR